MVKSHQLDISHWTQEPLIEQLCQQGFCVIDTALNMKSYQSLVTEFNNTIPYFKQAAIQNGVVPNIRSDQILWLQDPSHWYILLLKLYCHHLNPLLLTNMHHVETHFSYYQRGSFYAKHRDNPHAKNHRVLSTILYLNDDWQPAHQGLLHLQDTDDQWHKITPIANRLVVFQSQLLHEVEMTLHSRSSVTAWLRSDPI